MFLCMGMLLSEGTMWWEWEGECALPWRPEDNLGCHSSGAPTLVDLFCCCCCLFVLYVFWQSSADLGLKWLGSESQGSIYPLISARAANGHKCQEQPDCPQSQALSCQSLGICLPGWTTTTSSAFLTTWILGTSPSYLQLSYLPSYKFICNMK